MKYTYITLCLSLLLLSLAGCKQDEMQSLRQSDTRLTSVKATTSAAVKSRTQLSGNAVIWEQSDAIGIFSNTTAEAVRYDLTEIQGDEARFESETGVSGEEFYAFYPYSAQSAVDGTKISYRLTDGQDYRAGSFDTGDCPMVAKSTNSDFRFLQTCGIIRLRLTGTMAVSAIRLQGNNGEALAGDGTIDVASDAPVFTIDGNGDKQTTIQLRTSANVQLSELSVTEFYFVVAPQTLTQGITVDITGTINGKEQTIRKQTQKSITVTRSVISSFAAVDTDAELEPEGPTDRDILIALYDATNGDNWTNNTNWCTNAPLSEWYGVTLDYSQERVQYIHLSYNNLVGSIPEEIGNLTELYTLDLSGNTLTGEIPSSIGNMHILGYLYLNNNQLTGSIPQEIGNLSDLRACYIYENQLMGNIPSEFGNLINLEYCYLFGNQLTGEVPETLSRLTKLQTMDFSYNMLGGDLPEAVTATDWWQINGYRCIEQNEPGGFTFETLNLYIPDFTATDNRGNTIRTIDIVSSHKVTLYYVWATWCGYSKAFHPVMSGLYQRYKNHSLEIIGVCDDGMDNPTEANNYIESNNMEWPTLMENPEGGIPYSGFPTVIAFDETGKMIFHSSFTSRDELPEFLKGILGEGDAPYESTDFSADRKAYTLQTASEGNGINVVLMGDAFSDRQIADGTYEKVMQQAADAFFSEEPYASFRDMFNVYYVNAVSQNEGYFDGGETAFSCYFGEGTRVGGNDGLCMQYAQAAFNFTDEQMQDVLIIVMMNSTRYAGTCWMYYNTGYTSDYGRGTSVAYFPIGTSYEDLATILHHEAGGHGFAKLNDEYAYEYMGMIPANEIRDEQNMRENYGWGKNTDYISDPARVYWSKFIADSRYASENIGVYEGACTYWTGAYRPTENSIMNDNTGGFNAPSREAIYYRIHKLAYGESWTYDYEEFVNWDLNQRARSRVSVVPQKKYPPTAPPVIIKARWENGRFVYE
ncbi:redoxin domain-containing protein [Bacteroides gallinaceum]|uniref:M64 family metallopeptidase n=1 Tax=Bacteroides gallinaceum TaxID=1462571 RepID=UPI00195C8D0F|nr:M64 family metallopeptidase [Bacteroides gallinaceum]MBM6720215.1 redoxin domain-containing protein [Bacteroides gallinaceum]